MRIVFDDSGTVDSSTSSLYRWSSTIGQVSFYLIYHNVEYCNMKRITVVYSYKAHSKKTDIILFNGMVINITTQQHKSKARQIEPK